MKTTTSWERVMISKKNAIIIGAGPAGLTAAIELQKNGSWHPIVLEETDHIGGISASMQYKGNRMDLGGHRFFSKSDEIMDWWTNMMPVANSIEEEAKHDVMLLRNRVSRIYYLRKFFDYPISMKVRTFTNMGLARTFQAGFGYIFAQVFRRKENNLEDFMINRFGAPLYHMFFEDYTEKVWGRHPKEISSEWGAQRIKGLSLMAVVKDAFKKIIHPKSDWRQKEIETSLIESFLYPKYGPGHFWEMVAAKVAKNGGDVLLNSKVETVLMEDGHTVGVIISDGAGQRTTVSGDVVFSSMPIKDLVKSIKGTEVPQKIALDASELPYRDFITVGLLTSGLNLKDDKNKEQLVPDCWIYIQEPDVKLGRLQIFNNWSPYLVADPKTVWLGLEYFCSEGDTLWEMDDSEFIEMAKQELISLNIVTNDQILDGVRIKVKKAYPSYFGSYSEFDGIKEWLDSIPNLYCIGRNGQHRYNNMDHSMLTAMEAVKAVILGSRNKESVWGVNTEETYHEEKKN